MRGKRLAKNTIASLVFQICTLMSGFILPRLILVSYGSETNGLVNSINQFLHIISFLELGVGAVVQSSLYKPLAEHNDLEASKIVVSAGKFFKRIGGILFVYVIFLMIAYPYMARSYFDHLYTATLIAAISISSFAQYYFGVVDRLLLTADQRGYLQYNAQTITLLLNTAICAFMIVAGASIHIVKLTTSLIYLARPIVLRIYVNRTYNINRKVQYTEEPIKQKWNGIALHVSSSILDGTDNIVLTILASLSDVSIYSVYHLVVFGVKYLFLSLTNGIQALLGELWAINDQKELKRVFGWTEWVIHTTITLIFGCTGMLIVPFIRVYTIGINDANYVQPLFSAIIVSAHAIHCLCQPYNIMIKAGGHYKQTQNNYIIAALINIIVSVLTVQLWGLIGVAIGTFVAMAYQTIWMVIYNSHNLLRWKLSITIKQMFVDIFTVILCSLATSWINMPEISYPGWLIMAFEVFIIWSVLTFLINRILYKDKTNRLFRAMLNKMNLIRKD